MIKGSRTYTLIPMRVSHKVMAKLIHQLIESLYMNNELMWGAIGMKKGLDV